MAAVGRTFMQLALKQNRLFSTTNAVKSHIVQGGRPGNNLPFDIHNRWKLAFVMAAFLGSGLAVPFIAVRYQLLKK